MRTPSIGGAVGAQAEGTASQDAPQLLMLTPLLDFVLRGTASVRMVGDSKAET